MKLFRSRAPQKELRKPAPAKIPDLPTARVAALYRGARVGGDFYDFIQVGSSRLLLLLLDIAGKRDEALHIAAAVQDVFHGAADIFYHDTVNEAVALTSMALDINRGLMEAAGGVRYAPAFIACYNEVLGTCCYINAGHPPAMLKHNGGVDMLEASGLPLGLFSHATHEPQICALPPSAALILVSRGLIEAKVAKDEYGLERVQQALKDAPGNDADLLCKHLLENVRQFLQAQQNSRLFGRITQIGETDPLGDNDTTAIALVRCAAVRVATP